MKLATLLAQTKQHDEARLKFGAAAEIYAKQEFDDKALAVLRQAVSFLPKRVELWERIAQLDVKRERIPEAIKRPARGQQAVPPQEGAPVGGRDSCAWR